MKEQPFKSYVMQSLEARLESKIEDLDKSIKDLPQEIIPHLVHFMEIKIMDEVGHLRYQLGGGEFTNLLVVKWNERQNRTPNEIVDLGKYDVKIANRSSERDQGPEEARKLYQFFSSVGCFSSEIEMSVSQKGLKIVIDYLKED